MLLMYDLYRLIWLLFLSIYRPALSCNISRHQKWLPSFPYCAISQYIDYRDRPSSSQWLPLFLRSQLKFSHLWSNSTPSTSSILYTFIHIIKAILNYCKQIAKAPILSCTFLHSLRQGSQTRGLRAKEIRERTGSPILKHVCWSNKIFSRRQDKSVMRQSKLATWWGRWLLKRESQSKKASSSKSACYRLQV